MTGHGGCVPKAHNEGDSPRSAFLSGQRSVDLKAERVSVRSRPFLFCSFCCVFCAFLRLFMFVLSLVALSGLRTEEDVFLGSSLTLPRHQQWWRSLHQPTTQGPTRSMNPCLGFVSRFGPRSGRSGRFDR